MFRHQNQSVFSAQTIEKPRYSKMDWLIRIHLLAQGVTPVEIIEGGLPDQ